MEEGTSCKLRVNTEELGGCFLAKKLNDFLSDEKNEPMEVEEQE